MQHCLLLVLCTSILGRAVAAAQQPWTVKVASTMNPLPIGACARVRLDVIDPATRDWPRRQTPSRDYVTIADFDMTVTSADGKSVAPEWSDAFHLSACGCQGGTVGSTGVITATYPARALPVEQRVPGVAFKVSGKFSVTKPQGRFQPAACAVQPPGSLEVAMAADAMANNAVELILDASGSMLQMLGKRRKMDIARSTLVELVEKTIPAGTPFAFRAFGTRIANCESDLLLDVQPLDRAKVGAMIRKLNATNGAKTPLAASLLAVGQDLKSVKGQKVIVLLTDGEETCGGDPAQAIQALKAQGLDIRVNVVGFDVADAGLKVSFERWATLGGGRFFEAKNGEQLSRALADALRPKFQVTDAKGTVVAEGTAGGAPVELPVGTYTVRVLTSPVRTFERIKINPKARQHINVKGGS